MPDLNLVTLELKKLLADPVAKEQLKAIVDLIASAPNAEAREQRLIAIQGMSKILLKRRDAEN